MACRRAVAAPHGNPTGGRLGLALDAKVVLFAGKLIPLKRPLDLVESAAQLSASGCKIEVLVAGSGPLEQQMVQTAQAMKVPLHVLGFCNQQVRKMWRNISLPFPPIFKK